MLTIKILHRYTNACLWEGEAESLGDATKKALNEGADLRSADLSSANLSSADLSSADLRHANLSSADLSYANLRSADLSYANLRSANLSSANLSSADLSYANLRYADLRYADLSSANLSSADLSYADLRSADLPEKFPMCRMDFGGWSIWIRVGKTSIGCQTHDNEKWLVWTPEHDEIKRMASGASEFWANYGPAIKATIEAIEAINAKVNA